jgi:hypothetical protein
VDWEARKGELVRILETAPRNGSGYTCIVPSSGGKDSHAQVLTLIELGAKPLVVTASTCHLTPIGRANIDNLSRYATTVEITPNRNQRAKLNRLGLELVGDISWPEHVSIFTTPFKAAVSFGIPLLFYGENPQNQYGGPLGAQGAREMTRRWVSEFGGFLGLRPSDMVPMAGDMSDYLPPSSLELEKVGVTAYFLGQFIPWDSHANADKAKASGMRQELPSPMNWWKHENLDNAQTGLHDFMCYRKYGFGRASAQLSVDIRAGRITREEALPIAEARDAIFPEVYAGVSVTEVLRRLSMTRLDLHKIIDRFTNRSLFPECHSLSA